MAYSSKETAMADAVSGRLKENFCQPCSRKSADNVADIYCEDCTEYQCKECVKVHDVYSVMSKHKWINANEASSILPKYDMKGIDQCQEHNRILEFYCEDDNKLCCSSCAILSHRKCHTVIEITTGASKSGNKLTELKQTFLQIDSEAGLTLKQMVIVKDRIGNDSVKITERIKLMQDNVNNIFENLKITVAKDIANCQQKICSDFVKTKDLSSSLTGDVNLALAKIENVSQHGTPSQQFIVANYLTNQVTKLQEESRRLRESLHDVVLSFDFDETMTLSPDQNIIPGKLTINYIELRESYNSVDDSRVTENNCTEERSYDSISKENLTVNKINKYLSTKEKRDNKSQDRYPYKVMDESSSTNEKKYDKKHSFNVKDGSFSINENSFKAESPLRYQYIANDDLSSMKEMSFDQSTHAPKYYLFNMNERNCDTIHQETHTCKIDEFKSTEGKSNDSGLGERCLADAKAAISSTSRDNSSLREKYSSYETDDFSQNNTNLRSNTENLGYERTEIKNETNHPGRLSRRQKKCKNIKRKK